MLMLVGGSGSRAQPCSSSQKQSFLQLGVSLGMVAWVRMCRLAQQSSVLCDPRSRACLMSRLSHGG